jgi:hypothetical protein
MLMKVTRPFVLRLLRYLSLRGESAGTDQNLLDKNALSGPLSVIKESGHVAGMI